MISRLVAFLFAAFLLLSCPAFSQDNPDGGNKPPKTPLSKRAQRKIERKKWREARKQQRAERKAVRKKQKELQTKKVYRRMKRDKRKAMRNNAHKREFFLKRWFSKKQK